MQKASSAGEHGGAGADPDAAAVGFGARATADARSLSERTKEAAGGGAQCVWGGKTPPSRVEESGRGTEESTKGNVDIKIWTCELSAGVATPCGFTS